MKFTRLLMLLSLQLCAIICNGQLKDFSQLVLISRYSEAELKTFLKMHKFKYEGDVVAPGHSTKMKSWGYKNHIDGETEGAISYTPVNNRLIVSYLTTDPEFLSLSQSQLHRYGYTLDKKVQKPNNDISYIYSNKENQFAIRIWKQHHRRLMLFIISNKKDIDVLNN